MNLIVDIRSAVLASDAPSDDPKVTALFVYERQFDVVSTAMLSRYSPTQKKVTLRNVEGTDGVVHSIYGGFTAGWTLTDGVVHILMINGDRIKIVVDEGVDIFEENEEGIMVFPVEQLTLAASCADNFNKTRHLVDYVETLPTS